MTDTDVERVTNMVATWGWGPDLPTRGERAAMAWLVDQKLIRYNRKTSKWELT